MSNEHRIWRSYKSDFAGLVVANYDDLTDETFTAARTYDDAELAAIAKSGFNGIWVHGLLNNIVSAEPFPELGRNHLKHKAALRELIARAAKHGVKVFIYMQPPRAVPVSEVEFWKRHPDVAGEDMESADFNTGEIVKVRALCTSTEPVRAWLKNAARQMAVELPGLGGIIMITASELPAHCYSQRQKDDPRWKIQCPRCGGRNPSDIVVEVINLITEGVKDADKDMEVIAWNWSWTMWGIPPPCHEVIDRLSKDVVLLADFERGGRKDFWKRPDLFVDEYSLAYAGPSELCLGVFDAAKKHGMRVMSKLQLGTTHELASVVSLPLLDNIFKKASYHKHSDTAGFMGCWNFGNHISTNTAAFNYFLSSSSPDDEGRALESFASSYFPGCDAPLLSESWRGFTNAMGYYPFCIPFIYNGPVNYTLAYPQMWIPGKLSGKPAGPSHLIVDRGDDLRFSFDYESSGRTEADVFSLDEIIIRLEKLAEAWAEPLEKMKTSLSKCPGDKTSSEIGNAAICGAVWRSAFHTFKVYRMRRSWNDSLLPEMRKLAADELDVLRGALPFVEADPRQGFHAEAHGRMFDPEGIQNKIRVLEKLTGDRK